MVTRPHAFVAMPFGRKPGPDGSEVDYNRVYRELIAPAIEAAGLTAFRADQEQVAGSILTDMFQELLIADLVVADLSISNANVWYEVGVRHALRSRGMVLLFGGQAPSAFDLYADRKLRYTLAGDGPDPQTLPCDKAALSQMIRETMASWHQRRISPVYFHLPNLQEPDWRTLKVGHVKAFWDEHGRWEGRIDIARQAGRIGDLLVLADEGPIAAFRADAWLTAGIALRKASEFALALDFVERSLVLEPSRPEALREKGICLQRLAQARAPGHSLERARKHYEDVLASDSTDVESWALLGRVEKDAWVTAWNGQASDEAGRRREAADEEALLRRAIRSYEQAMRQAPGHYFSGINVLTLRALAEHLGIDPGADARARGIMAGAVRFAAESDARRDQRYWAAATLADLEVLEGTPESARRAYRDAVAVAEADRFALRSSREQLRMLALLGFRPDTVGEGLATIEHRLTRLDSPEETWQPRHVLLFSGHMMDRPARNTPRFPREAEPLAREAIEASLEALAADDQDVAYCQAAAGGDLLFLEACQARGVRCRVLLPFNEAEFIAQSVLPSWDGPRWRDRFYAVLGHKDTRERSMPQELGPVPRGADAFERCNLWLLYSALALGPAKVRFITLWDGGGGDGPGGTAHMKREVERHTGRVDHLDTRTLFAPVVPPG